VSPPPHKGSNKIVGSGSPKKLALAVGISKQAQNSQHLDR